MSRIRVIRDVVKQRASSWFAILRERQPYADIGADDFEKMNAQRLEQLHVRRLTALGYSVTLTLLPTPEPVPA